MSAPRIGVVLGAGGTAGHAYHTATLNALRRLTGWDPRTAEVIVGTSAGAGVAAMLRGGVPVGAVLERILSLPTDPEGMARLRRLSGREGGAPPRWWFGPSSPRLVFDEVFRGCDVRTGRLAVGLLPEGRIPTAVIGDRPRELHGNRWPDEPTWLVAVRLDDGERVVFGRDGVHADIGRAVEASCAIPAFFRPVGVGGARYVDGGIHSPTNADLLLDVDLDLVVISSPLSGPAVPSLRNLMGPARLVASRILRREVDELAEQGVPALVLEPSGRELRAMGPNLMDPTRVLEISLETAGSMLQRLRAPEYAESLAMLRAAASIPSPPDVAYPE